MDLRQSYKILGLRFGADLETVKSAFRTRARASHPDLHPDDKDAARKFQELNKAYIYLREYLAIKEARLKKNGRTRTDEKKRPDAAAARTAADPTRTQDQQGEPKGFAARQEEKLREVLDDPFARQVFEDIFQKIRHHAPKIPTSAPATPSNAHSTPSRGSAKKRNPVPAGAAPSRSLDLSEGVIPGIKKWAGSRLDDFQTVHLPAEQLRPGAKVRIALKNPDTSPRHIDIRLPRAFAIDRPIRVKKQGRSLGPFKGDLYLTLLPD